MVSQIIYDLNPLIYILGFIIFGITIFIINSNIPNIESKEDCMRPGEDDKALSKKEKKNIYLITILYGVEVGAWFMGLAAFNELVPLISTKVGYLNAIYTTVEIIALFVINAKIINWFKKSGKLLFWQTICAVCDMCYLLIISTYNSWQSH